MPLSPSSPEPDAAGSLSARSAWILFAVLALLYAFLCVREMELVGLTVDEPTYFNSGQVILREGWEQPIVRLHGPIPYYMNQLFVGDFPSGGFEQAEDPGEIVFRGRLGTLPFGLAGLLVVFLWSRRLFGPTGGLISAALFATSPLMIGYGGLLAVDVIHTATVLACLFSLWLYVTTPSRTKLFAIGISLGIAFATKYLALLNGPVVVIIAASCAAWRKRESGALQASLAWLATAALISALAIGTLHATYGFATGFAPSNGEAYRSELIASLVDLPAIGTFLASFPRAYLLGVDYQMTMGEGEHWTPFVDGRFANSHADYYLRVFLWKTPEWTLLLIGWLCLMRIPRWALGRGSSEERTALWVLGLPALVALCYLSLFTGLQIGVRYVLPLFPMAFILCGTLGQVVWIRRAPRLASVLGALLLTLHAFDLRANWPNLIAYFNHLAGGQARGHEHFNDSNTDWGQLVVPGLELLEETETQPFEVLSLFAGPRFGRVAIKLRDFVQPDVEDPSRARHWLHAFEFERHVGGAWWLFDITRDGFREAVERASDERVRADFAVALLGAGEIEAARAQLNDLSPERAEPLRAALESIANASPERGPTLARITAWRELNRHDRVAAEARSATHLPESTAILADALAKMGRPEEAIAVLEEWGEKRPATATAYLATLYEYERRFDDALALIEGLAESADAGTAGYAAERLVELRPRVEKHRRFWETLR